MRMTYNKNLAYYKLLKKIGNPNAKMFSDGFANIDNSHLNTTELRQKILDFHQKYYSANIMTLAIVTSEDFKTLRRKVEANFNKITNKDVARPFFNETTNYEVPLPPHTIGKMYYLKAYTDPSKFTMIFQMNSDMKFLKFHPIHFFSTFINYFSENSFKQTLIRENLITNFDDTIAFEDYVTTLYGVSFQLTAKGEKNLSTIVDYFFKFIKFVQEIADKKAIFESLSKTSKFAFLFNVKSQFIDFSNLRTDLFDRTLQFSENLQDYPPEMMFTAMNILSEFNRAEFDNALAMINPLNAVFILEDKKFKKSTQMQPRKTKLNLSGGVTLRTNIRTKRTRKLISPRLNFMDVPVLGSFDLINQDSKVAPRSLLVATENQSTNIVSDQSADSSPATNEVIYRSYFDDSSSKVLLDEQFDFDNNRAYNVQTIPSEVLSQITIESNKLTTQFDTNAVFDTSHLDYYDIISECSVPETLKKGHFNNSTDTNFVITIPSNTDAEKNQPYTPTIFKVIFNDEEPKLEIKKQFIILRDLLSYKLCLVKEFNDDDKTDKVQKVHNSNRLEVFHSLYRKTLQPTCIVYVIIEPETYLASLLINNYEHKIANEIRLEILCAYIAKYFPQNFNEEYIKGNTLECKIEQFRMVLTFKGITNQIESFISLVLSNFIYFAVKETYKPYLLNNIKQVIINNYLQFESITSIKLALYYMNLFLDKMTIDYSTQDKLNIIKKTIQDVTVEDLMETTNNVLNSNNILVLGVGNIDKEKIVKLSNHVRTMLKIPNQITNHDFNFIKCRTYIQQNFITDINFNEHLVIRLENNDKKESNSVYLTFFRIHRISRQLKFQGMLMNHYLHKFIYDELRNKLNLGYVAQSALKAYYHVN